MLNETDRERIRRGFHLEKRSIRQLAREEERSRKTIRRAVALDSPKTRSIPQKKPMPVFGPYKNRVEFLWSQNEQLPRKQQYTAHRIFEIIREEGYQGCESTVRRHVALYKQATHKPELFLPLEFEPGLDAQVDWVRRVGA